MYYPGKHYGIFCSVPYLYRTLIVMVHGSCTVAWRKQTSCRCRSDSEWLASRRAWAATTTRVILTSYTAYTVQGSDATRVRYRNGCCAIISGTASSRNISSEQRRSFLGSPFRRCQNCRMSAESDRDDAAGYQSLIGRSAVTTGRFPSRLGFYPLTPDGSAPVCSAPPRPSISSCQLLWTGPRSPDVCANQQPV